MCLGSGDSEKRPQAGCRWGGLRCGGDRGGGHDFCRAFSKDGLSSSPCLCSKHLPAATDCEQLVLEQEEQLRLSPGSPSCSTELTSDQAPALTLLFCLPREEPRALGGRQPISTPNLLKFPRD